MYADSIDVMAAHAAAKIEGQKQSLPAHLARSMLAGMYVGAAIVLIFTIGGALSKDFPAFVPGCRVFAQPPALVAEAIPP